MMQLLAACKHILGQLENVVRQINEVDFSTRSVALHATIGQHLRHTIEFFICLEDGLKEGIVNYDKRNHDPLIETDRFIALAALQRIQKFVADDQRGKQLRLEVGYERESEQWVQLETNYERELVYNIEHAVHHMAIMKIGIREVASYVELPADFGIAVSTLRFKEFQAVAAS